VALVPGAVLGGRFRIVAKLGEGGMGEVYRAEDLKLGQAVALKFLTRRSQEDPARRRRLLAEVRLGRQVAHPCVCRLFDIVELGPRAFVVMEYVDGEDLASLLRRIGRLPPEKGLIVARELCAGLAAIHDQGIVHRDLKPGNVMIDGCGRVRITDFGLARELGADAGERSGTPAYMAPEQLRGEPTSPASDVYAWGLACYEILSGRRVFAGAVQEVMEAKKHPVLLPPVEGVDSEVRGVIERCLAQDPRQRPRDARAVLRILPGADPLTAAVAAGETPSPEMVAAAEEVGGLSSARAMALLAFVIGCLACLPMLSTKTLLHARAGLPHSPATLERLAGEILTGIGVAPDSPGSDRAGWFELDGAYLDHLASSGARDPWQRLGRAPHPLRYHLRWSPQPLVARDQMGLNRITSEDPPPLWPGMVEIVLGAEGHLRRLVRVPPAAAEPAEAIDWRPLLERTGLETGSLQAVEPERTAPVDTDRKWAWAGLGADASTPVRVEAASYGGRAVFFEVTYPWEGARRPSGVLTGLGLPATLGGLSGLALAASLGLLLVLPPFAYMLARRNLRRRRVDLRGALKVSLLSFVSLFLGRLLRAHHVPIFVEEWATVSFMVAESAFWALNAGFFYLAVEPFVRRRWPHILISWNRVLDGRLRDPMVGRDTLVGFAVGAVILLAWHLSALAPSWLGLPASQPLTTVLSPLSSPVHAASTLVRNLAEAVFRGFGLLALLVLCRGLLRDDRLAFLAAALPLAASFLAVTTSSTALRVVFAALAALLGLALLLRQGLLALTAAAFLILCGWRLPLTLEPAAWYAARSAVVLALLASLALWAFTTSLAGKPLIGRPLFEED
jgi:serine/threonine-protein kinase